MSTWRHEYLKACQDRDRFERRDAKLIDAYTRLADRTAKIESQKGEGQVDHGEKAAGREIGVDRISGLGEIRRDLSEAQHARTELQNRLRSTGEELDKLKVTSKQDARRIEDLSAARTSMTTRMRDRNEELKGKSKLLEDVQDEVVSLNIQLNMAEKRAKTLEAENKDLVARLMAWKGKEADAVNDASRFS